MDIVACLNWRRLVYAGEPLLCLRIGVGVKLPRILRLLIMAASSMPSEQTQLQVRRQ